MAPLDHRRGQAWLTLLLALLLSLALGPRDSHAHGLRSAYLELREQPDGRLLVTFRLAIAAPGVAPHLPADCQLVPLGSPLPSDLGPRTSYVARCAQPLAGSTIGIDNLGPQVGEGVLLLVRADGQTMSELLTAQRPLWTVPGRGSFFQTARRYVGLGMSHILQGTDHLLFLVLLVLTLQKPRAVLLAESAFTLSHSLTFSANALGWLQVAPAAAEAAIALSLLLLALDVGRRDASLLPLWRGAALALVFCAVHGLGFASGLREVGLPAEQIAAALCGFGVGVELGQLGFALLMLGLVSALSRGRFFPSLSTATAYAAGTTATVWLFERLRLCWHPFFSILSAIGSPS